MNKTTTNRVRTKHRTVAERQYLLRKSLIRRLLKQYPLKYRRRWVPVGPIMEAIERARLEPKIDTKTEKQDYIWFCLVSEINRVNHELEAIEK